MIRNLALGAVLILVSSPADATTCTVSTSGIAFGTYSPFSTSPNNSNGTLTITCKGGGNQSSIPYAIALNSGVYSGGSFSNRRMILSTGGSYLSYQLYTNASYSQIWGDGLTGGTSTVSGSCVLTAKPSRCTSTQTIYGQIPALQTPFAGSYSDTITVTVTY